MFWLAIGSIATAWIAFFALVWMDRKWLRGERMSDEWCRRHQEDANRRQVGNAE